MKEKNALTHRHFSKEFKKEIIKEIDRGKLTIRQVCELYDVSNTTIYNWLYLYSVHHQRKTRIVVEKKSQSNKLQKLQERLKELESMVGRKQMRIEYLEKLMELTGEQYGVDFEKKGELPPLNGTGSTKENTDGK